MREVLGVSPRYANAEDGIRASLHVDGLLDALKEAPALASRVMLTTDGSMPAFIREHGGIPTSEGYKGYPKAICISGS